MKIKGTQKTNSIPASLRAGVASLLLLVAGNSLAVGPSTLNASDSVNTSSFNTALHWSGLIPPGPGTNFFSSTFTMRTPVAAGNYSFAGDSLTINTGGGLSIKGGSGNTITLNNLTNSGAINNSINANTIAVLTGSMTVVGAATFNTGSGTVSPDARVITNNLTMSGTGTVTNTTLASVIGTAPGVVVYTANNTAFTGPLIVNSNQTVQAGALNNLGGNPAIFNAAQFVLNAGTFQPTASITMNNANSGVTLGTSGGTFNVGSGLTLTIANPITGAGSLTKSSAGTLILSAANTYANGTVVNGGIISVQNSSGLGTNGTVTVVNRNSSIQLQGNISLSTNVNFTTSNDGITAPFTNAIENISGNNTINGTISLTQGGGNTAIQSDSGALLIAGKVTIAAGQTSRGIILQGSSTAANTVSGSISDLSSTSVNSVTKNGLGNWTLTGTNTYTGLTIINAGTLFLSGNGSISNTVLISIASGATFDVSGLSSTFSLNAGQNISNSVGTVNGSVNTLANSSIYPATAGVNGTLTFNNNLNMNAGGTAFFDLSTTAGSGNDQVVVSGNLTLSSSDYVHINALSGFLDTVDYVLFSVAGSTTMSTTPVLVWDGAIPGNYLNYSLVKSGNNVVLHFSASTAPSVTASVNPTTATRNQSVTVSASVTKGSGNITNVTVDLTQIGGASSAALILDTADSTPPTYVYTNTFFIPGGVTLGSKSLTVTATDDTAPSPLSGTFIITSLTTTANAVTWDGGAADDKWTSNINWASNVGPGFIGDSVTFAGTTRLTPDMNTNFTVTSLTFDATAGAFTIGSSTVSTLTSSGGIVNNSSSTETLNVPVVNTAAQTFNAASGSLTLNSNLSLAGNTLTVDGVANTTIAGVISGTAGIQKNGSGTLVLTSPNTFGNNGGSDASVNVGALAIGNDSALGTSRLNIADGGIVQSADSSAHTITNRLNFGSGANGNVVFGGTGNLKLTGSAANGTDKIITVNNPQTELAGAMSGASARTIAGTGILILSAANSYSSFTTINSGATLQLGNGGTNGSLATSSIIDDEGTLIFNRSDAMVQGTHFSGAPITGAGSVIQAGSGTTTLNAANTYAGNTTVNNGELFITPNYQNGGNVLVANNAKFGVSASSVSNSATIGNLNLGTGGATTLDFSYGLVGNPTNAALVANAVTISGTCAVRVGGSFTVGTFPVLKYSTLSGVFSGTVVGPRGVTASLSNDTINHVINVTISSVGSGIVWTGTNSVSPGLWDLNTTTNWQTGGLPTVYIENVPPGDAVTFNDSGNSTVSISNTVSPANVTINNSSANYTFQGTGQIVSSSGLTKTGAGSVTMNVPGTFSGTTILSNGPVNISANQSYANLSGNSLVSVIAGSPTITVNETLNTTFAGGTLGNLGLTKNGVGNLTLPGTHNFTGNFFVSGGTVTLDSGSMTAGNFTSIGHLGTDNATLTLMGVANFTTTSDLNAGDVGSSVGTVNIQDNATLTANAIYVGSANSAGSTASGTVNQFSGTVTELATAAGSFSIGGRTTTTSVGGVGTYNLSGGTLIASSTIRVGAVGVGSFNQTNGTVFANGGVDIATAGGAAGTYEFDGGFLRTPNITSSSFANGTFNFNGGVLIPTAHNSTFVINLAQANVRNGGVIVDTTNFNVTIGSTLQHSVIGGDNAMDGGLTKRGNGTLSLTGLSSSYTGPTVVSGGALNFGPNSQSSLNNVTVNNAALGLGLSGAASFTAANVSLTGNTALNFFYDPVSGNPSTALNITGTFTASGTTTIGVFGYGWTVGQYTLVDYTGSPLPNLNNFVLGSLPYGVTASLSNNVANSSIDLVVTGVSISTWIPLVATDVFGSSSFAAPGNWQDGNPPTPGNGYFTRTFALRSPADANPYNFGGSALSVDDGGRFIMKGTGGQVMTVNNLIINGGLVDYANAADSFTQTLAGNITLQGGILSYIGALGSANLSETLIVTAPIGGSGNLQLSGSPASNSGTDLGVVIFAGNNTYTGTTTVATGTLLVNGANGNSPITVNASASLGGTGTIGGTINVQSGGTLAPGIAARGTLTNTIGTLTATAVASVSGAVAMKINRDVVPNSDKFVAPSITINSGSALNVANLGSTNFAAGDTFTLFSTPVTGSFSSVSLPTLPSAGLYWTNKLAINGTIAVASLAPPASPVLTNSFVGGNLNLSWPAGFGFTLQVQTNSLVVGLGTNWVDVPGSATTNAASIPVTANVGAVFYRLRN